MVEITKTIISDYLINCTSVYNGSVIFNCFPSVNQSSNKILDLKDQNGNYDEKGPAFPSDFYDLEIVYFKKKASNRIANCIEFVINNNRISEIKEYWDEKIIEDFNANLPKSKRGKIKAWYDE